jgi:hypothetical protein
MSNAFASQPTITRSPRSLEAQRESYSLADGIDVSGCLPEHRMVAGQKMRTCLLVGEGWRERDAGDAPVPDLDLCTQTFARFLANCSSHADRNGACRARALHQELAERTENRLALAHLDALVTCLP